MKKITRRNTIKGGAALLALSTLSSQNAKIAKAANKKDNLFISVVSHSDVSNPFQAVVGRGVDQAAIDFGVRAEYIGPDQIDVVKQIAFIDGALAKGADGFSLMIADPTAMEPKVKEIVDMGIPVILHQGGAQVVDEFRAECFIGEDSYSSGVFAAKTLINDYGCKHVAIDNHVPGELNIEVRGEGFRDTAKAAGVKWTEIITDVTSPAKTQSIYEAAFQLNPTIDGISGGWCGVSGLAIVPALENLGMLDKVTVGIMDYTEDYLKLLKKGKVQFTTNLQQYLMGYLSVAFLTNKIRYGLSPTGIIKTGPSVINRDNTDNVLKYIKSGSM